MKSFFLLVLVMTVLITSSAFTTVEKMPVRNIVDNSYELSFCDPLVYNISDSIHGYRDKRGRNFVGLFDTVEEAADAGCKSYRIGQDGLLRVF